MYEVNVVDEIDCDPTLVAAARSSLKKPVDLAMWHRRLAHSDIKTIERMCSKNIVDGLDITGRALDGLCEDCIYGKMTRRPFDDDVTAESEPLERVHLDLWGKARTQSWSGAYYMLLISDSGTGIKTPFFLSTKNSVIITNKFEEYHLWAERQTGHKLRCARIDLGGEFDNQNFLGYCAQHGIQVEKVPKASSAAHGHAERGNRTVIEGARTQLIESGLDSHFWAESVTAQCYVRGFIPTRQHPDQIPWSRFLRLKTTPNISHIRVWGSTCWVKDLDCKEGKLGKQAWKGKLVGYMGWRGYRVYDPEQKGVYQVHDVIFEEGPSIRT